MEKKLKESSVDQIVNGIKMLMINQKLKVGDKLPTEFELSEMFGKSRSSVREAIKILTSYGVLEVRRGDGTYVSSGICGGVFDALFFQIISMKIDITELIQLRELLETGIMKVIVENREEDCYRKMKSIQEELIRAIQDKNSIDQLVELDLKFHKCMAEFAGNTILEQIYNFMLDIFTPYIRYSYVIQNNNEDYTVANHHDLIIEALHEMDLDLAQYAIKKSMKDWLRLNCMYQKDK